ncbi:MAG: cytochrome P450 [Solirubrobacteraceae bacterium]|nr:cytochrome P450 [Solirubrobacteraceae bacterium]
MAALRSVADLPTPPGSLPIVGSMRDLLDSTSMHRTYERWIDEVGPYFRVEIPGQTLVVVADHAVMGEMMRARPDTFRRWRHQQKVFTEITQMVDGVFFSEGEEWRQQRKLVNAALNMRHLQRYFDLMHTSGCRLHARLNEAADGASYDITRLFYCYTVDVTSAIALGHDLNTLENGEAPMQRGLELMFREGMKRMFAPLPYWRVLPLRSVRELKSAMAVLEAELVRYLERGKARVAARPELLDDPENALDAMLAAQRHDGTFTDAEILSNINVLLTAGEDTTANTLGWTSWFLATRPELQRRIAEEAEAAFGDDVFPTSLETVDQLVFTEAVLKESTRLRSVTPMQPLEALVDTTVADIAIPAGTVVLTAMRWAADGHGPDGEEFRPDRWLDDGPTPPKTYAFGAGPRFCPGRNLAFTEAKSALAMLCRDFEFTLDESSPVKEELHFTLVPVDLRIHLRPRVAVTA